MRWPRCGGAGSCARARRCCWSSTSSSSGSSPGGTRQDTELVAALRQCDGEHVQAIVMVRDDFWMAATRFMRDLEIRLVEGENSAAVDLFDPLHARKVLTAFGRAYGVLPEKSSELTPDQQAFLDQSVAGLAQDGKVISVRLALFAEMVKGKPWTPATLREVGGTEGVGVTFLEETFSAPTAPPEHRLHQKAAQAVLEGPPAPDRHRHQGPDAVGGGAARGLGLRRPAPRLRRPDPHPRPRAAADHARPIPRARSTRSQPAGPDGERYYQLTHDYLVHSLRDWLTRKQRETRRGRAELRLAERAAIWEAKPENRHLPSVSEWASIRTLTRPKDWTEPQRRMMRRAGRVHGLRALAAAVGIVGLAVVGLDVWNRVGRLGGPARDASSGRRRLACKQLLTADTADVPALIQRHRGLPPLGRPGVEAGRRGSCRSPTRRSSTPASPCCPSTRARSAYLERAPPRGLAARDSPCCGTALRSHRADADPEALAELESAKPGDPRLLPIAGALALYDPDNPRWAEPRRQGGAGARHDQSRSPRPLARPARAPCGGSSPVPSPRSSATRHRPETEHDLATTSSPTTPATIPTCWPTCSWMPTRRRIERLFPVAEQQAEKVTPVFQAELHKKPNAPGTTRRSTRPGRSPTPLSSSDRIGPGPARRPVRLLPDDAAGRVLATRRGLAEIGLPPRAVPALCRRARGEGRGGLDPRRAELADRAGRLAEEVRRQDEKNRAGEVHPRRCRRIHRRATPTASPPTATRPSGSRAAGDDDARMYVGDDRGRGGRDSG